ncbi:replication restart helicase PriA [Prosthecochloris sp. CIB 2401]|uniref:replication restart helicase PriA n=1 Tax=Prosthecochloris sp. CIB 2401 TaxID=1868325 RepID=UPI00080A98FF|nr:primosomal protein N' [Prosthecochloris sp. CIB 2401]ANT64973.1 Primosomal protein N' [Prosthecochloris sp. CIB 2401]
MIAFLYAQGHLRDEPIPATLPLEFENEVEPGSQVIFTPEGRHRKSVIAYIADLAQDNESTQPEGSITDILNNGTPVITRPNFRLALWMARYYLVHPVEAIGALLPAPLKTTMQDMVEPEGFRLQVQGSKVVATSLRKAILGILAREQRLTVRQLERRLGKKNLYRTLGAMQAGGLVRLGKSFQTTKAKTRTAYRLCQHLDEENASSLLATAPKQLEAVMLLLKGSGVLFPDEQGIRRSTLEELRKKGITEKFAVEITTAFSNQFSEPHISIRQLTVEQQAVLEEMKKAAAAQTFAPFLLHGVTGSGKTIVYIELLKTVLAAGRTAIVLVPEISLTPQTASRFSQHFGDRIQILHSAMSSQEKYQAWQKLRTGKASIALGARSTIFAPLENIGAIIVDEEHDTAYKQDRTPRYHGRDTAVMRAKLEGAVCVLGSATPSFESYTNALGGKYRLLQLPNRVDHAAMPALKLVPMLENRRITPSLSETLYLQIKARLEKKEQVILLQNRRGYAGSILCQECGHIPTCPHCGIPMVYHAAGALLRCHYCGYALSYTNSCPKCHSENIFYRQSGTQRIASELATLFPGEKILRMDVDTTGTKGAHAMLLKEFRDRNASILLGTQMVAKGLDFPDVTLVGVLMADIGLSVPDFRASERLFSLMMQVAGRAGRASKPGEVYLQAYDIESPVYRFLLNGSYEEFYHSEAAIRKELGYPPFARLISIECSSPDEDAAATAAHELGKLLNEALSCDSCTILGPAPAALACINGRYRHQVVLKLRDRLAATTYLKKVQYYLAGRYAQNDLRVIIDVDPQNMM